MYFNIHYGDISSDLFDIFLNNILLCDKLHIVSACKILCNIHSAGFLELANSFDYCNSNHDQNAIHT